MTNEESKSEKSDRDQRDDAAADGGGAVPIEARVGVVFWAALIVGLLLTLGGVASMMTARIGSTPSLMLFCSGLGVVFGAFGATATIRYKGVVIAGVTATAIALLAVLDYYISDNYVEIEIKGYPEGARLSLTGDRDYPGAENGDLRKYDFIVLGREIRSHVLGVIVEVDDEDAAGESRPRYFNCIRKAEVEPFLGSGRLLQWRFGSDMAFLEDEDSTITVEGECRRDTNDASATAAEAAPLDLSRLGLIAAALAGEEPKSLPELFAELESKSSAVRRAARGKLAAYGPDGVRPMLDRLASGEKSYQTRLGIVVSLAHMLRDDKWPREAIAGQFGDDDLRRLAAAAGDSDKTLRIYATEILVALDDPRIVRIALESLSSMSADGRYNLLLTVESAYPKLTGDARDDVDQRLNALRPDVGEQSNAVIDRILLLNAASAISFRALKEQYVQRYKNAKLRAEYVANIDDHVDRLRSNHKVYEEVAAPLGIPWYFVGILHGLNAGYDFSTHLHNGDPLTERTVHVPAGRPAKGTPPFSWAESARDALELADVPAWQDWGLAGMLYQFERLNGFGYRKLGTPSPYLWSFTDQYSSGSFVADGKFDLDAVAKQAGAAAILLRLIETGTIEPPKM